ncbi:MAG: vWA domain-containing protein [Chloroflexota bacterium]
MTFLAPAAALALLAIPVIILIHYLRGSRRRLRVPSVELWQGLAPGLTARNRVKRPPLSLLLLLQILIGLGLALALMRPAREGDTLRHLGLVIDASASMQASDVGQSRFEAARQAALSRINSLAPTDQVTLVRGGYKPTVEFAGPAKDAEPAVKGLKAGASPARLDDAVMRAALELSRTEDLRGEILVFTDAATDTSTQMNPGRFPLEVVTLAGTGGNQAITDLSARIEPGARAIDVFAEISNYEARPVRTSVQLLADDLPLPLRQIDLPANGRVPLALSVPLESARITARLSVRDALPLDDIAEVALPSVRPRSIMLVSRGSSALERALRAIPGARVLTATPEDSANAAADLTVFDGVSPKSLPSGAILLVHPPGDNGIVQVTGDLRLPPITTVDTTHPLLNGVDVTALRFMRADRITAPAWGHTVLGSPRGPLIVEGVRAGQPIAIFAFDPVASGFEKSIGFPVLVANTVSSTLARVSGPSLRPGQVVSVPAPSDSQPSIVIRPDGQRETLSSAGPGARFDNTDQIGRYSVLDAATQRTARTFSVSLLNGGESNIAPRAFPRPPAFAIDESGLRRLAMEWWWPLVAIGIGLLAFEWLVFARRG